MPHTLAISLGEVTPLPPDLESNSHLSRAILAIKQVPCYKWGPEGVSRDRRP